jgi:hypothetical protein
MKKSLFIFTALLLFSCSSSSDDKNSSKSDFNPPDWIQGTWILEDGTSSNSMGFKFSSNDFCTSVLTIEQCQQPQIDLIRKGGQTATVEETISNSTYIVKTIYYGGMQSVTYSFKKISSTKIELVNDPLGDLVATYFIKK